MQNFLSDSSAKNNFLGLFNVVSANITELEEVPVQSINQIVDVESYIKKYAETFYYRQFEHFTNSYNTFRKEAEI